MNQIKDGSSRTNSHWKWNGHAVICIDFDHTITKKCLACDDGLLGDGVQEGAKEALIQFKAMGFDIWIYTGDPNLVQDTAGMSERLGRTKEEIEEILSSNGIPYDRIMQTKPPSIFIIDDRAISHKSWETTLKEVKERLNRE